MIPYIESFRRPEYHPITLLALCMSRYGRSKAPVNSKRSPSNKQDVILVARVFHRINIQLIRSEMKDNPFDPILHNLWIETLKINLPRNLRDRRGANPYLHGDISQPYSHADRDRCHRERC
jgi:hypothetical protein